MNTVIKGEVNVPEINDTKLNSLCERILPVVRKNGALYYIEPVDPRKTSYIWSPTITTEATGLKEFIKINTIHKCSYYGFFKPSVAEVLAQIPDDILDKICAFEIDGSNVGIFQNGCGHSAITTLYEKE